MRPVVEVIREHGIWNVIVKGDWVIFQTPRKREAQVIAAYLENRIGLGHAAIIIAEYPTATPQVIIGLSRRVHDAD